GVDGVTHGGRVLAAALGDVRLAATAAAEGLGGRADQVAGLQAAFAGRLVGGDHRQRPAVVHREEGHDGGPAALDPAAHVEDQLAQVVGGRAVRHPAGDHGDPADVLGALGQPGGGLEHLLGAELLDLLLGVLELAEHGGDLLRQLLRAALQQLGELVDHGVLAGQEGVGVDTDQGLDAAHTGADGGLAEQFHQTQLGGVVDVGAAAQLLGEVADGDHADPVAVLLAELGDGALLLGLVDAHDVGAHVQVAGQHLVDLLLDVEHHRLRHGGRRAEVEAEAARLVLRAGLGGRRAERVAQGLVGEVGGRVGAGDGLAAPVVDGGVGPGADGHLADLDDALVDVDARDRRLAVADLDHGAGVGADPAGVADLAAALGVERGAVEDDLDLVALGGGRRGDPV